MPDQDQTGAIPSDKLTDVLGLLGGGALAKGAASAKAALPLSKAIVPPFLGAMLPIRPKNIPDEVAQQLLNQGHEVTQHGIGLNTWRYYDPAYVGKPTLSGGTFYGVKGGDPDSKKLYSGRFQSSQHGDDLWRGYIPSEGKTWIKNPLIVNQPWGHMALGMYQLAPEHEVNRLYTGMEHAADSSKEIKNIEPFRSFMRTNAPTHNKMPFDAVDSERLPYWGLDTVLANKARQQGYDSIINYGPPQGQTTGPRRISELYDLRENRYPSPQPGRQGYSLWPEYNTMIRQLMNRIE